MAGGTVPSSHTTGELGPCQPHSLSGMETRSQPTSSSAWICAGRRLRAGMLQLISAVQGGGCQNCPPLGKGLETAKLLYICTIGTLTSAAQIRCCCWQAPGSGGQPVLSNSANPVLPQFPCLAEPAARCVWLPGRKVGTAAAHVLALASVCSYKG